MSEIQAHNKVTCIGFCYAYQNRINGKGWAMQNLMPNFDQLGPVKVIHVHVPGAGLDGVLVVDNVAAGPAIGGLRGR
jgi:hypothetical protein